MLQYRMASVLAALLLTLLPLRAQAVTVESERVNTAAEVLREIMSIPEQSIPPQLLRNAYAVAIIPSVIKVGFFVGGRYGQGVLCVRDSDGDWSNPTFITIGGGSLGLQIGAQSTDIILVFKSRTTVEEIINSKFTIGASASAAAGPVGRLAEAGTDIKLDSEIYSYSRSRGLFAGVSLEGAVLEVDHAANANYYRVPGISPRDVLAGQNLPLQEAAERLRQLLQQYAHRPAGG